MGKNFYRPARFAPALLKELSIIRGEFVGWMERSGYPAPTIRLYQLSLERVAVWLCRRGQKISSITGQDVPVVLQEFFLRLLACRTKTRHRAALHAWLRFRSLPRLSPDATRSAPWRLWVEEYDHFLANDNGLSANTRIYRRRYAKLFMSATFGCDLPRWERITPQDIWRFSERFARRVKPSSANIMLGALRSLFRYVHLRGLCGPELANAVPQVANYGRTRAPCVLSEQQQRLIRSLPENTPTDLRDKAMILCMLELGLRVSDVAQLRIDDFDDRHSTLSVFSPKTGERRRLPLNRVLAKAIGAYVRTARSDGGSTQLFLRIHPPLDQPAGTAVIRCAARRAYARCGFSSSWTGTHRLRHSFATTLYARGANLTEIGDLLGHRCVESTMRYAQTDLNSLRALAQPWPR